jgi:hypothetical protein
VYHKHNTFNALFKIRYAWRVLGQVRMLAAVRRAFQLRGKKLLLGRLWSIHLLTECWGARATFVVMLAMCSPRPRHQIMCIVLVCESESSLATY